MHDDIRNQLFQTRGHNGDILPTCTRYATVIPAGSALPIEHVHALQEALVCNYLAKVYYHVP